MYFDNFVSKILEAADRFGYTQGFTRKSLQSKLRFVELFPEKEASVPKRHGRTASNWI
jgi:hypothetical protein